MIISNISRIKQVQTWFFQNKSEQNCSVQFTGSAHSGTPARPSQAWPTSHIRKITGISPSPIFFFHTKFLQKVRLDQTWKLSKIVTYVVVSTMSDIFFVKLIGITVIWLKMWDFTRFFGGFWASTQTRQTQFSKWMQRQAANSKKTGRLSLA